MKNLVTQLIALILLITPAFALETGELRGKVTDAKTKMPLDYASLTLVKDGKIIAQKLTDDDGEFIVKNLVEGNYLIRVTYAGYFAAEINPVEIVANAIKQQDISVKPNANAKVFYCGCCRTCKSSNSQNMRVPKIEYNDISALRASYSNEINFLFPCLVEHKSRELEQKIKTDAIKLINQMRVFPNPVANILHVESMFNGRKQLQIINLEGRVMLTKDIIHHQDIDIGWLDNGLYFVVLLDVNQDERITDKILVQH